MTIESVAYPTLVEGMSVPVSNRVYNYGTKDLLPFVQQQAWTCKKYDVNGCHDLK
jgi:hypothetical protein